MRRDEGFLDFDAQYWNSYHQIRALARCKWYPTWLDTADGKLVYLNKPRATMESRIAANIPVDRVIAVCGPLSKGFLPREMCKVILAWERSFEVKE